METNLRQYAAETPVEYLEDAAERREDWNRRVSGRGVMVYGLPAWVESVSVNRVRHLDDAGEFYTFQVWYKDGAGRLCGPQFVRPNGDGTYSVFGGAE